VSGTITVDSEEDGIDFLKNHHTIFKTKKNSGSTMQPGQWHMQPKKKVIADRATMIKTGRDE